MRGKLRNDEIALVALLTLSGDKAPIDTEEIAIEADRLSPGRFRWRKFKEHIDLGLVRNALQDARKKSLVTGGALRGWGLNGAGILEAARILPLLADTETRERIANEQKQWEARERGRLIAEPAFQIALERGPEALSQRDVLRLFKLDEYASDQRRSERLSRFAVSFADDPEIRKAVGGLIRRLDNE